MNTKLTIITILAAILCAVCIVFSGAIGDIVAAKITCASFHSQLEAQAAFNQDPVKYAVLDGHDKDQRVCENLPKYPKK